MVKMIGAEMRPNFNAVCMPTVPGKRMQKQREVQEDKWELLGIFTFQKRLGCSCYPNLQTENLELATEYLPRSSILDFRCVSERNLQNASKW
jgi:hypothetical protein